MKYLLIYIGLLCTSLQLWGQETVATRIVPPTGYVREACSDHSFTGYLRNLPLMPKGSKVMLYNGKEKANQSAAYAVIDMEIGNRDLQQCADAVMRLRAEYLYGRKAYDRIHFNFTNGFRADYTKWAEGYRISVKGNQVSWYKKWAEGNRIKVSGNQVQWYAAGKGVDYSYKTFRNYLDMVFMYAGTASLSRELQTVSYTSLQPGDVFIKGGSPGHAVIVVDVAVHPVTKKKVFLLAQSYMPAQQIHILVNPVSRSLSPWYELAETDAGKLYTPEWIFSRKDLKRFKE